MSGMRVAMAVGLALVVVGCSSGASPTPSPTDPATAPPTEAPTASPTDPSTGPAALDAPDEVNAGAAFEIAWTGPNARGDYITIVAVGATKWTNEPYFDTNVGSPGRLTAPLDAGSYELWYVNGADDTIATRRPITVVAFTGSLDAPAQVAAGTEFEVSWTGPDGPGDYITIVAAGTERWTSESWAYTSNGSTVELLAPITAGPHEIWYVPGTDPAPLVRRPITVTALAVTLDAPARVAAGADFEVTWTGPDGPSDYITIVPAGSAEGTYLDYAYTSEGNPVTITAPELKGNYEIWYASDRVSGTFASRPIIVE